MAIRNFWVDAVIDGRKTKLSGGPKLEDGGMDLRLYQRDKGMIKEAVYIHCAEVNGQLLTNVYVNGEKHTIVTVR